MGSIKIVLRCAMRLSLSLLVLPTLMRLGRGKTDEAVHHLWSPIGAR
jgi:hypothetical protein